MQSGNDSRARLAVLWNRVDDLIDSAPSLRDLRVHGLQLLAARRWRELGRAVPPELAREELRAEFAAHAAPALLAEVRAACEGPILLLKGPAAAARFPTPTLRPFVDIDLVVPDAGRAQQELLDAGFLPTGEEAFYATVEHHLRPLRSPRYPFDVEVHSRPKWVAGLDPPGFDELAADAERSALGVDGILSAAPARDALVLAAHLWAHEPLTRLLRIVDIALAAEAVPPGELEAVARAWGMSKLWSSTAAIIETILLEREPAPWLLRLAGQGLTGSRESTVLEVQAARLLAPIAIHEPHRIPTAVGRALAASLRPGPGESWSGKLRRSAHQLAHPSTRHTENLRTLESGSSRDRT